VVLAERLRAYRSAQQREPVSAGAGYPSDPDECRRMLESYLRELPAETPALPAPADAARAVISPHIDYARGGLTYAQVWSLARPAVETADLVVVLGTDHHGPDGAITLTRQRYSTPWGALETDVEAVDQLAGAIGTERAFAHEYHHAIEHSVELAAVWLRHIAPAAGFKLLPIICGSFAAFVDGRRRVEDDEGIQGAVAGLRALSAAGRRVLFVAAVDLAHIGPAFGGSPVGPVERGLCAGADERLLQIVAQGNAAGFLDFIRCESDRRNVCGVPPLYVLLRVLEPARGITLGYRQCPADMAGASVVSIAGGLLW
jgi:AmmeMemoRadiSam system protein B